MSLPLLVDPEARAEFDQAYDYYEGQRAGLGDSFADAVEATFDRVAGMPKLHPPVFGDIRRAVVRGYPYCIYYRDETTQVRILSVFHASRDPNDWQSRG